jgi:hypothetical protein
MGGVYDSGGGRQGSSREEEAISCFKKTKEEIKKRSVFAEMNRYQIPQNRESFHSYKTAFGDGFLVFPAGALNFVTNADRSNKE